MTFHFPLDDDLADTENGECPDCGYAELNADSEEDEMHRYAVSCPRCKWTGHTYS